MSVTSAAGSSSTLVMSATRRSFIVGASALTAVSATHEVCAETTFNQAKVRRAAAFAKALHAAQPTPALSIAVAATNGVTWAEAFGKADLELDVAATPAHTFRLGSVSKVLTATAAVQLASRGKLDLDAPISTWLDDLPPPHRRTTMRQLLTHRGGVRHFIPRDLDPKQAGGTLDLHAYATNNDILAVFINDPLIAPPGEKVVYSTFGFTLASLVMEAAARQPFTQLIETHIGEAFALKSLVKDEPVEVTPLRASGYNKGGDLGDVQPRKPAEGWMNSRMSNPAYSWAGAGFLMTPVDIARFGAALPDSPASRITRDERTLLFTPQTEKTANMPSLGLAWRLDVDARGRRRWHHAGATIGGRASLVVYPDIGLSIAIASNVMTAPGDVLTPSSELADVFA
jgi:serine beta-lactamase-like protein LACTB, mitochondrial